MRIRAIGQSTSIAQINIAKSTKKPTPIKTTQCYFEVTLLFSRARQSSLLLTPVQGGRKETPLYLLSELGAGDVLDGPAIILDNTTSTVVEPDCRAEVTDSGDVKIIIGSGARKKIGYVDATF